MNGGRRGTDMADAHGKPNHDYHLVDPSPWPFVGSMSAFIMAIGAILWMKGIPIGGVKLGPFVFGAGLIGVLYTMFAWWADVIAEADRGGYHTRVVQISHRYGMILFIASEIMFFVAWFWAFFDASLFPGAAIQASRADFTGGHWPPKGVEAIDPFHLPLFNTLILLTSGTTVTWAASCASREQPLRPQNGSRADDFARAPVHVRPSLRVYPRAVRL